jgi:hypothetical protein
MPKIPPQQSAETTILNLEIRLESDDSPLDTSNLQDWIRREDIDGLAIQRRLLPGPEGTMGDAGSTLEIVLGSAAVVQLVRSIHVWLKTRRRNVKIHLKTNDTDLRIEIDSPDDEQAIVKKAEGLIKAAKS